LKKTHNKPYRYRSKHTEHNATASRTR